ncbi:MAG: GNAT family N-acetyltransferase [Acidimicrobiales bacterium]
MQLRLVQLADAGQIREIYNHEVTEGTSTFDMVARSIEEQRAWIQRHQGAHPAIVAVEQADGGSAETVFGFGSVSPYRDRAAYATTVENSIYVREDRRGQGVGGAILTELLRLAAAQGFHAVIARISAENRTSVRLHGRCGFEHVGVEREVGRKHGRWLDIVELQKML